MPITGTWSPLGYRASKLLNCRTRAAVRSEHREALLRALRQEVHALEAIADVEPSGTLAESLRLRLVSDLRLLEDLGADGPDHRGMYAVTVPREELELTLTRFHEQALEELELLGDELGASPRRTEEPHAEDSIHEGIARALALRYACLAALFSLRS